jgi:ABC-type transporter Mla maintaining outer membrane lipid asymmetry ATPase subunit MlaF
MYHYCSLLSTKPSILVLDKPSIGLDPRTIVMDEGRVLASGLTIESLENQELLTTHGLEKAQKILSHLYFFNSKIKVKSAWGTHFCIHSS